MQYLDDEEVLYGTFTTPENSVAGGAAVCSFNLSAIEDGFSGKFLVTSGSDSVWTPKDDDHSAFQCKQTTHNLKKTSNEYQLVSGRISPTYAKGPVYHVRLYFTTIGKSKSRLRI